MKALLTKTFTFDAAHQLIGHNGKCANLHGHTYKLEVSLYSDVKSEPNPDEGFVIDFADLKQIVKRLVLDPMDHSFLAAGNEPALAVLLASNSKVCTLGFRTTCENMAAYICYILREHLQHKIHSVKLWETPTGCVEVFSKDISEVGPDYRTIGSCDADE